MSEEKTRTDTERKSDTVTIRKDDLWKYSTFALLGILVLGAIFFVLPGASPTGNVIKDNPGNTLPAPTANLEIQEGDYVKGNPDAPVVIFEFSDFECPFCAIFYDQTYSQIVSEYVDSGKVAFVYNHFPLSFHPNAQKAAEATECAGEQGKFWEMHDILFEKGVSGGVPSFKTYASELSLNKAQFDSCIDSGKYSAKVNSNMQRGTSAGVQGTPGFIINGRLVSGAQPFSVFKQIIDAELA